MAVTAQSLGTLMVNLTANTAAHDRRMLKSTGIIQNTERVVSKSMARTVAVTSTALAAVGTLSIRNMVQFDDAMSKSTSIMLGMTDALRAEMEETARVMSTTTVTSANDLAEAYYFLASAGLDAKQSMQALRVVEKFAVAGAFDMALATDLLTDAQSALGLTTKDTATNMKNMNRVGDVLVKANTLANASVQQFSESLTAKAGAALKNFNKDVEEGVAVLAAYADQGVKANLAGESLNRVILLLNKSALSNREAMERYGISVFDADGKMRGMADIIGDLERAFTGMSDEQRSAALEQIGFTAHVQGAILPLIGASGKIRAYEKSLRDAGGTMRTVADNQLQSVSSKLKILGNNFHEISLQIAERLMPMFLSATEVMLNFGKAVNGIGTETFTTMVRMAALVTVVGPLLLLVAKFGPAIATAAAEFAFFAKNIGMMATLGATAVPPLAALVVVGTAAASALLGIMNAYEQAVQAEDAYRDGISSKTQSLVMDLSAAIESKSAEMLKTVSRQSTTALAGVSGAIDDINAKIDKKFEDRRNQKLTRSYFARAYEEELNFLRNEESILERNIAIAGRKAQAFKDIAAAGTSAGKQVATVLDQELSPEMKELMWEAEQLRQSLMTPFEQASVAIARYETMLKSGAITLEEFNKAVAASLEATGENPMDHGFQPTKLDRTPTGFNFSDGPLGFSNTIDDYMQKNALIEHQNQLLQQGLITETARNLKVVEINSNYLQTVGILKPIEAASLSLQNNMKGLLEGTVSWQGALRDVASTFLSTLINAFIQAAAQYLAIQLVTITGVTAAAQTSAAAATATTAAAGGVAMAAWTPAAIAASIATLGAAAGIGSASFAGALAAGTAAATLASAVGGFTTALAQGAGSAAGGQLATSFDGGGFTGSGDRVGGLDGKGGFAAILHPNEVVTDLTRRGSSHGPKVEVVVHNYGSNEAEVRRSEVDGRERIEVIIGAIKNALTGEVRSGDGDFSRAMEDVYGVRRGRAL